MRNYEQIIINIYKQHNPEKVSGVSDLLHKYQGQEEELLESLFQKYNIPETQRAQFISDPELQKTVKVEPETVVEKNVVENTEVAISKKTNYKPFIIGGIALGVVVVLLIVVFGSPKNQTSESQPQDTTAVNQTTDSIKIEESTASVETSTTSASKNKSIDAKSPINHYYEDLKSEDFDANRYFVPNIERFISMRNTTPKEINIYILNTYFKQFKENSYSIEEGTYNEQTLENGDTEVSFIEVGNCFKVKLQKNIFTRVKMVVYVNSDGLIYKWLQTEVLEKR